MAAPESQLCRDVRECIADFMYVQDLAALMSVNKEWQDVIVCMPCSHLMFESNSVEVRLHMMHARLSRHISGIASHVPVSMMEMSLYFFRMPHLTFLEVTLDEDALVMQLPTQLQVLALRYPSTTSMRTTGFQSAVHAIGKLRHLRELKLVAQSSVQSVDLSPLTNALALKELTLDTHYACTIAQAQQLCLMRALCHIQLDSECPLDVLFANPQQFRRLQSLACKINDDETAAIICQFPSLTQLTLQSGQCTHTDFLRHLPALTSLSLKFLHNDLLDTSRIATALQSCTRLRELTLDGSGGFDITSEQLASCVQRMSQLYSLKLFHCKALRSLSFLLSANTLRSTLAILHLGPCDRRIPLADLRHVRVLCHLCELSLDTHTFDIRIDEYDVVALLPGLKGFTLTGPLVSSSFFCLSSS
jgi:hypothetical protein